MERRARLVAVTDMSVLIRGENGSGKELVADLIHRTSARDGRPFVPVDCGAIPKELGRRRIFRLRQRCVHGSRRRQDGSIPCGGWRDAVSRRGGQFALRGADESARVLQERRYRPIGGRREYACDVRIVAATNENIERAIAEGRFREDLYHRLNEFTIELPPLRECADDILPLAEFFLTQFCEQNNRRIAGFTPSAVKRLKNYGWPGNVRELRNTVRSAALLSTTGTIDEADLVLPATRSRKVMR